MRCRKLPKASSTQCLWITDEILADAFNSFLRVSNAHSHHAKRFHSNAPGPLEARRRATRRRMGMAAATSGSGPPPFDLGALFGLGVKPGVDMEKGMNWQGPQALGTRRGGPAWTERFGPLRQRSDADERIATFLEIPAAPVDKSKAGFDALLASTAIPHLCHREHIEPLLEYLQSSRNEPEAWLTARLVRWLHERSPSEDCWSALAHIVKHKVELQTISEAEAGSVLRLLHKHKAPHERIKIFAQALPGTWIRGIFTAITRAISELTDVEQRRKQLREWVACLRELRLVEGFRSPLSTGWHSVHAEISKHIRPSDLAEHFSTMQRKVAATVLLHHWVPKLAMRPASEAPHVNDGLHEKALRYKPAITEDHDAHTLAAELLQVHRQSRPGEGARKSPLVDLLQVLGQRRLPLERVMQEIVSIYIQTEPANAIRNLFKDMVARSSIAVPTSLASKVVQSFTASGDIEYALQIFEAVPTIPLSECYDLPLQLIGRGKAHGERTFRLINRFVPHDTVTPVFRTTHHTMALKQDHVDLVHLIAYAYAKSPHTPARVALRRVWECYRFLRDRRAPLGPLMSRAFVLAGIARPLSEQARRPSARQTAYILQIVRDIEGWEPAQKLDALVYALGARARATLEKREKADALMFNAVRLKLWKPSGWTFGKARNWTTRSRNLNVQDTAESAPNSRPALYKPVLPVEKPQDPLGDASEPANYAPLAHGRERHLDHSQPPSNMHASEEFVRPEDEPQKSGSVVAAAASQPQYRPSEPPGE